MLLVDENGGMDGRLFYAALETQCTESVSRDGSSMSVKDGQVSLDIGAGDHPRLGFIHLDLRLLPHIELVARIEHLPILSNSVDQIFCSHTIEHVERRNLVLAFRELYRVLKPGGRVRVRCPDIVRQFEFYKAGACDIEHLDWLIGGAQEYPENYHKSWFSEERLMRFLTHRGFECVRALEPTCDRWEAWQDYPAVAWPETDCIVEAYKPRIPRRRITISGWPFRSSIFDINRRLVEAFQQFGYEVSFHCAHTNEHSAPLSIMEDFILFPAYLKGTEGDIWINHVGSFPKEPRDLVAAILPCDCTLMNRELVGKINEKCDLVFTPSNFSKSILRTSGIKTPIEVVPNGVDISVFTPEGPKYDFGLSDHFIFFVHSHFQPRKGLDILLSAFVKEFSHDEKVALIIKESGACNGMPEKIRRQIIEVGNGLNGMPTIRLVAQDVDQAVLASMLRSCDCFAWATRIEGFGIPPLEALACGKPVITPQYGGYMDYITEKVAYLYPVVGEEQVPVEYGSWFLFDTSGKWSIPDEKALRICMRNAFHNRADLIRKGEKGVEVARKFTWENAMNRYREVIEHYLNTRSNRQSAHKIGT